MILKHPKEAPHEYIKWSALLAEGAHASALGCISEHPQRMVFYGIFKLDTKVPKIV